MRYWRPPQWYLPHRRLSHQPSRSLSSVPRQQLHRQYLSRRVSHRHVWSHPPCRSVLQRHPPAGDGISVTTLSVSILTSGCPTLTAFPLSTYHSMMIPSVSPSPISGNLKIYLIASEFYCSFNLIEDLLWCYHIMMLTAGVGDYHVKCSHAFRGRFKMQKSLLVGQRHYL